MFKSECPHYREGVNGRTNSGQTPIYNCIAFSVWEELQYIWPDSSEDYAWPPSLPRNATLTNFIEFYKLCGYLPALNDSLVGGIEKIVIYTQGEEVLHAARQLENGTWVSKIGDLVDVIHYDLHAVSDGINGRPRACVWRRATGGPPILPEMRPSRGILVNSSGVPLTKIVI